MDGTIIHRPPGVHQGGTTRQETGPLRSSPDPGTRKSSATGVEYHREDYPKKLVVVCWRGLGHATCVHDAQLLKPWVLTDDATHDASPRHPEPWPQDEELQIGEHGV